MQKHADCPTVELLPYAHAVHDALPVEDLNVPAGHGAHGPPFGPVNPPLQRQFVINPLRAGAAEFVGHTVQFVLASGAYCPTAHITHVVLLSAAAVVEYVPTEQLVQFAVPFVGLYVPGGHAEHCPLEAPVSGPVYPALHKHCKPPCCETGRLFHAQQSCDSTVPGSDLNPTGHALQEDAAVIFENVSASHSRHGEASGVGLNEPGGQDTHSELFVPFGACPKLHVSHESVSEL